jgi:hypothetical protein
MSVKVVEIEREGNPFYPLPADYAQHDPTSDYARMARVNACRQWMIRHYDNPALEGQARVASVNFFDRYYLWPDPEAGFDPMFYREPPLPSAPMHDALLAFWGNGAHRATAAILPRGGAKTALNKKDILCCTLTCPKYSFIYATSTQDNCKAVALDLMTQYRTNERILHDFSPEFDGGYIVPMRGELPFGSEWMTLKNGAWVRLASIESGLRGGRPNVLRIDDAENDVKASTSMELRREYMHNAIFHVGYPMIMQEGGRLDLIATFVSRQHYAWAIMQMVQTPDGLRSHDRRFDFWARLVVPAEYDDPDTGERYSCWEDNWPLTKARRLQLAVGDPRYLRRESLEEYRERVGEDVYLAEMLASPGQSTTQYFGELNEKQHGWWLDSIDSMFAVNPRASQATFCYYDRNNNLIKQPLAKFLANARLFMTCDTSYTATLHSDYKVACLMAVNSDMDLFVLDLWASQCHQHALMLAIFQMADRWQCPSIHIEAIKEGLTLFHECNAVVNTRSRHLVGNTVHLPSIHKVQAGNAEKSAKIAALRPRVQYGSIKLPTRLRGQQPWRMLFAQFEEFNPNARDGGLEHDDCIDAVQMEKYVLKGRVVAPIDVPPPTSPIERLRAGVFIDEKLGVPTITTMPFSDLKVSDVEDIMTHDPTPLVEDTLI